MTFNEAHTEVTRMEMEAVNAQKASGKGFIGVSVGFGPPHIAEPEILPEVRFDGRVFDYCVGCEHFTRVQLVQVLRAFL